MSNSLLTIILPAYNAEFYIKEAIDSILNQTFLNFELLIADDGSTDNTKIIIDSYSDHRIKRFHNEVNNGKIQTVNKLFQKINSNSNYITIHDADDISMSNRYEKQIFFLEENPDIGFLGTSFESFTATNPLFSQSIMPHNINTIKKNIKKTSCFHGPTVVYRRECLDNEKTIYRSFFENYNEDCDLNCRLLRKYLGSNLQDVLYRYRILPNSLSKSLTPRKKVMYQIVIHLYKQRLKSGNDSLEIGNENELNEMIFQLTTDYRLDPSRILREQSELMMYYKMNRNAVKLAMQAILKSPFKVKNWGTLQYCIRKSILPF